LGKKVNWSFQVWLNKLGTYCFRFEILGQNSYYVVFLYHILLIFHLIFLLVSYMYSPRKREQRRVLAQERKDISYMISVLRQEFDKLQELFYEMQASERGEQ
jgi:hypothetical protein